MPAPAPRTPTGRRRRAAGAAAPTPRWRSILFVLRARRSGPSSRPAARSASAVRSGSMDVLATTVSDRVNRCEYADRPCCGATRRTTSRSRRSPHRRQARSATRRAKNRTAVEIVGRSSVSGWPHKIQSFGLYFFAEYGISLVCSTSTGLSGDERIGRLRDEVERLREELRRREGDANKLEQENDRQKRQIDGLRRQDERQKREIEDLKRQLAAARQAGCRQAAPLRQETTTRARPGPRPSGGCTLRPACAPAAAGTS